MSKTTEGQYSLRHKFAYVEGGFQGGGKEGGGG